MKRPLEAMPDLMAKSPVNLGIVRACGFSRIDAADRTDETIAAVDREDFLALFQRRVADGLNLLFWKLFPVHIKLGVGHA